MNEDLKQFVNNLTYWLDQEHNLSASISKAETDRCELDLRDEEGEEFYIGNYADPGLAIEWLGSLSTDEPKFAGVELVRVNSVVMQALGRHVAGWVVGYL